MEAAISDGIIIYGSALSISWKDQGTDNILMHVVWNSQLYVETFPKCDSPALKQAEKRIVAARVDGDKILMYNIDGDEITARIPSKEMVVRNLRDFDVEVVRGFMYLRGTGDYLYGRIKLDIGMMQKLRELMIQAIMEPVCNDTLIVTHNDRQHHFGVVQNPQ
jgi:hypothetical protein